MENKNVDVIRLRVSNKFNFKCSAFSYKDKDGNVIKAEEVDRVVDLDEEPFLSSGNIMITNRDGVFIASTVNDEKDVVTELIFDKPIKLNGVDISFEAIDVVELSINKPDENATMKFVQKMYDGEDVTTIGRFIYNSMKIGEYPQLDSNIPAKVNLYVHLVSLYVSPSFAILKKK